MDRGLFEINSVNMAVIIKLGYTWDDMFDPYKNAQVAAYLQAHYGWYLWSTAAGCGL